MSVDPKISFVLGIITTIALAISTGTVHLTNAIPEAWIPTVVAWNGIIAFIGTAVMTALAGFSSHEQGPITKMLKG